nr:putative reverse transcriptase domain-containing protein [Tanacetum cinerariifolium]
MIYDLTYIKTIAYRIELPKKLSRVHSTFHVSNLKKCLSDETLAVPLDEIQVDDKLHFIEEPVIIMDREVKRLKQSRIPIVKVCWNSMRGPEFIEKNLYNYDPNAYSFNNSIYLPQPQDENYLCNLCGNNSHDDYDCQQQFSFVYKQEPSYNQNYVDNYYPHESPSYPCCDYCGGSYETFQCQPDNQKINFSDSDQIQTPQYPDVNPPFPEISNEEIFQAKGDLMKSIQTFLERFNCIPFEVKPQILFQTWETFFAIECSQPEDSNKLFQKLLKNLKELAEYDQSTSTDRPIFLNDNEDHPVQNKESPENSSEETVVSKTNQEPPQDSNIHQLIEECSIKVLEEQKQKIEDTMLELVKIYQEKESLCIHDDINDLIESTLDSKLLLINSNSQLVHKSSISFKNTSQISSVHKVAPILSTKEPGHLLSMWYEHLCITPKTESDEVTESNAENLLPIPSKCEVTLEDEIKCDMPAKDDCSPVFTTFSNPLFNDNDNLDSSDDESLPDEDVPAEEFKIYSNPLCDEYKINSDKLDPHCFNVESDFVESLLNRDTFIDFSSKFDFSGELAYIKPEILKSDFDFKEEIRLIENLLYDNSFPRPSEELNAEIADTIIESIPLPIPVQDGNSQHEEIDIVTETDDMLPPGIENFADDPEGDICFLEELLIDDSILSDELSDANFEENPSIPRPPSKLPDVKTDAGEEIAVKDKFDDDSQIFMFDKVFSLHFVESEDTIFDPGLSLGD